jgi:hypothetical protein
MTASLPSKRGPVGNLSIDEIYEYFDGPRLFLAHNVTGQRFLAVHADTDGAREMWLYAPLSPARVDMVRDGRVDLHDAFAKSESGGVWRIDYGPSGDDLTWVAREDIAEDILPEKGERLAVVELSPAPRVTVATEAQKSRRDVLQAHLHVAGAGANEAPLVLLGAFLHSMQEMADAIGQLVYDVFKPRGRINRNVLAKTQLLAVATKPGSFAISMAGAGNPLPFGETSTAPVIRKLEALIGSGSRRDDLRATLLQLRSRTAAKYRTMLEALVDAGASLELYWGTPDGRSTLTQLSPVDAKLALEIVRSVERDLAETREVKGALKAMDVTHTRKFKIVESATGREIAGSVMEEAMAAASTATISNTYTADLVIVREVSSSGTSKERYYLKGLRALKNGT